MFKMHSKFYCSLCETVMDNLETYRSHIDQENSQLSKCCILCQWIGSLLKKNKSVRVEALFMHISSILKLVKKPTNQIPDVTT